MSYKTILVHLDAGKGIDSRLDIAFSLAQKYDAHLVGLHALSVAPLPGWAIAEAGEFIEKAQAKARADLAQAGPNARDPAAQRSHCSKCEWRSSSGSCGRVSACRSTMQKMHSKSCCSATQLRIAPR